MRALPGGDLGVHAGEHADVRLPILSKAHIQAFDDAESGSRHRILRARVLCRHHEGEGTFLGQEAARRGAVVVDRAAELEAGAGLLRMVWHDPLADWNIGWRARDQVESTGGSKPLRRELRIAQVAVHQGDAILKPVEGHGAPRQRQGQGLGLDADHRGLGRQSPQGADPDAADATSDVEQAARLGSRRGSTPGDDDIVGAEAVPLAELEDAPVPVDRVQALGRAGCQRIHGVYPLGPRS